jgi:hypothetical protein
MIWTPVTGIGDDAFYVTTPGIGTAVMIKKGSSVIQIRVYGFPVNEIKEKEKILAQDALSKLYRADIVWLELRIWCGR